MRSVLILGFALLALGSCTILDTIKRRRDGFDDCRLCDYVYDEAQDEHYSYEITSIEPNDGCTTYFLTLHSQKWMDEDWSDWPYWWHYMAVNVPNGQRSEDDAAFIYVSYRNNNQLPPNVNSDHVRQTADICRKHRIVTGMVQQVPNHPIMFTDDPEGVARLEDDMLSWTLVNFLEEEAELGLGGGDHRKPALVPMTRAAVTTMDAMTELVYELDGSTLEKFFMAGESKRGWTTWITGAIDNRVVGMAPIILTSINYYNVSMHTYQSMGGWPYFGSDYWSKGYYGWLLTEEFDSLGTIVDPYVYREGMNFPKLIVSGSSDGFFLLDDTHYFLDGLPGESKYWLMDNTAHNIALSPHNEDFWNLMGAFSMSVFRDETRPDINWQRYTDDYNMQGTIMVTMDEAPREIEGYWSDSVVSHRRDWRNLVLEDGESAATNVEFDLIAVTQIDEFTYSLTMDYPDEGYRAFWIKMVFDAPGGDDFIFTTESHVIPEGFPYDECTTAEQCNGVLV